MATTAQHLPLNAPITTLDEQFLRAALEAGRDTPRNAPLPSEDAVRASFLNTWDRLRAELELESTPEEALARVRDLVVYDIPDGTRSTLTVPPGLPVEMDAAVYSLHFVHTLRALGARRAVVMVHTHYNRQRGPEETKRFLTLVREGAVPMVAYSRERDVQLDLVGMGQSYELYRLLRDSVPVVPSPSFIAHFLLDYTEECFLTHDGLRALAGLPDVDVCIRHTKLQISGGWIPTKMLRSAYLYSQNGTLSSNWAYDEHATQIALALLAKDLLSGEALTKSYRGIDEVKKRHQLREVALYRRTIRLRPRARKLFVVGTPYGLIDVLA